MSDRNLRAEVRKWRKATFKHLTQKNDALNELETTKDKNKELSIDYWKMKEQRDSTIAAIILYVVVFLITFSIILHSPK